jgi:heme oxygenase|tara:strand:- start:3231 stop:3557 length:327 start_codon:yes stop_codon:yes gene_type:complete
MIWVVSTLLVLSVAVNVALVWGLFGVIDRTKSYIDFVDTAESNVIDFVEHLEFVHSLERYYGDETLQGLIKHSEVLAKDLKMLAEHGIDASEEMSIRDEEESTPQAQN